MDRDDRIERSQRSSRPERRVRRRAQRAAQPRRVLRSATTFTTSPEGFAWPTIPRLEPSDRIMIVTVVTTVLVVVVLGVLGTRLAAIAPPTDRSLQPTVVALATLSAPTVAASPVAPNLVAPTPAATATLTPQPQSVVESGGARAMLRAEPGTAARIVERLPAGSSVTELGDETTVGRSSWRRVKSGSGAEGWVDSSLLRRVGPASQPGR